MQTPRFLYVGLSAVAAVVCTASTLVVATPHALAQTILEQQSTLAPAEQRYPFQGQAGQTIAIEMSSEQFDTVLRLLNAQGEEIAYNDDFGGSLNSKIVMTLPTTGSYTVVARSLSGEGGSYAVKVRPATTYEVAYAEAQGLMMESNYEGAIAAYGRAIQIDPNLPDGYLGRVDAYWAQAYQQAGENFSGPNDLSSATRTALIDDYSAAANLYDQAGNAEMAQSMRMQAEYVRTGEYPYSEEVGE